LNATVEWYREMLGFVPDRLLSGLESEACVVAMGASRADFRRRDFFSSTSRALSHPHAATVIGDPAQRRAQSLRLLPSAMLPNWLPTSNGEGCGSSSPVTEFQPGLPVAFIADNAGSLIELVQEESQVSPALPQCPPHVAFARCRLVFDPAILPMLFVHPLAAGACFIRLTPFRCGGAQEVPPPFATAACRAPANASFAGPRGKRGG